MLRYAHILLMLFIVTPVVAGEFVVSQKNRVFLFQGKPVEQIQIKVGDSVKFVNEDPFYHNIFSNSEISRFDLGIFPQGGHRAMLFEQHGVAEIECSIHPYMYLKIDVQ